MFFWSSIMARRKNAAYTGTPHHHDLTPLDFFYRELDKLYPGDTPIPIPPLSSVRPKNPFDRQAFILTDFIARKIAPAALRAVGFVETPKKLEQCAQITDERTAKLALNVLYDIQGLTARAEVPNVHYARTVIGNVSTIVANAVASARDADYALAYFAKAAKTASIAAELAPDATWAAVNEMLQAM